MKKEFVFKGAELVGEEEKPFWASDRRFTLIDQYDFSDFYQRMVRGLDLNPAEVNQKYTKVCKRIDKPDFKGDKWCEYNFVHAFVEAKQWLEKYVDSNSKNWQWVKVHVNEYAFAPWSMTPLKPIWHRTSPIGGNINTPCVAKSGMGRVEKDKIFYGVHTANYKQVVWFGATPAHDMNLMSIDTGMSGNIFGGHYFDMNYDHLRGNLKKIELDFRSLI